MQTAVPPPQPRVLFVSHEASRTGAPMFLLHFLRWLRAGTDLNFDLLLAKDGPLRAEFATVAAVHEPAVFRAEPARLGTYDLVYSNTICNGALLDELGAGGMPVVTHVHELDQGFHWLGPRALARVVRQTGRYIACAQVAAARMQQVFNIPADRFGVHYEMIDTARVHPAPAGDIARLRREFDLPEDAFIVAACGTVDPRKAPDLFVQVAARIRRRLGPGRPLRCLWIGAQNSPDLLALLREDVRKLGLGAEVRFINEVPSPHALLSLGDLFCLTSREDPFPLVMLESALLGKPVLCFEGAGGAVEFCAAGGGLAVPYLDAAAMADIAAELLADPARRAALGQKAAGLVRERFSVEAIAPGLWGELKGILAARTPLASGWTPDTPWADIYRRWHPAERPQPAFIAAHMAREEACRRARGLVAEGRRKEAVQLLVQALSGDLATRQPAIIIEGLLAIAAELAEIDPRQAASLVERARQVAVPAGLRPELFLPRRPLPAAA